jgi:DNA-binding NarL/FixJ family response regulator
MPRSAIPHEARSRVDSLLAKRSRVPLAAVVATAALTVLGPRERQVADLLARGASNAEVAQELGMAINTVRAHLNKLYMRYGITTGSKRMKLVAILLSL